MYSTVHRHSSTRLLSLANNLKVEHRLLNLPLGSRKFAQGITLVLDRRMATPANALETSGTNDFGHEDVARPCEEGVSCTPTSELSMQFYFLTHPRSGSSLLVHILNPL